MSAIRWCVCVVHTTPTPTYCSLVRETSHRRCSRAIQRHSRSTRGFSFDLSMLAAKFSSTKKDCCCVSSARRNQHSAYLFVANPHNTTRFEFILQQCVLDVQQRGRSHVEPHARRNTTHSKRLLRNLQQRTQEGPVAPKIVYQIAQQQCNQSIAVAHRRFELVFKQHGRLLPARHVVLGNPRRAVQTFRSIKVFF